MAAERIADLERIFHAAGVIKDPAARAEFLDAECRDDAALRAEVEDLLRHDADAGSFMNESAGGMDRTVVLNSDRESPGAVIGPYKLLEQIGEGGMGAVYMAEQQFPVRRRVALKIIKPGMDTRQVIARFEAERQALALMDHPNIAKVLDAGTTDSGRPYFVMELVKGIPITQYCDSQHMTPQARLELFIPVCQAVQHAHQKGIIHRDLKPSNVMIARYDGRPVPKIIDFGVAKATGPKLTERTMFTEFGAIIGTLEYMSPEQAEMNQLDIDTRSDIYSLGVLLYELLTSTTPFEKKRLRTAAFDELLRILREEDPPKPSTRVSTVEGLPTIAANRSSEAKRLSGMLRGELDWIVMKCLEKDRNRRYETANGLAQDLQRFLVNEPVLACPPSATYRLRKFARRNTRAMVMAVLAGIMVLAVTGSFGWMARDRAARQGTLQRQIGTALTDANDQYQLGKLPEAMAAVKQAKNLLSSGGAADEMAARVRQWEADLDTVGRLEMIRLEQSNVRDDHYDSAPSDPAYHEAFCNYGLDLDQLEAEQAAARIRGATIRPHLVNALDDWANVKMRNGFSGGKRLLEIARLSDSDAWRNRFREAQENHDKAALIKLAADEGLAAQPHVTTLQLVRALNVAGETGKAVEILRVAQRRHPNDFWLNEDLAALAANDEAVGFHRAAVAVRPESPGAHLNLGVYLIDVGKHEEAEAEYQRALELAPNFALAHINLALLFAKQEKTEAARQAAREAVRMNPQSSRVYFMLGEFYMRQSDPSEAEIAFREAVRLKADNADAYRRLTDALIDQKKPADAEAVVRKAIEMMPKNASLHTMLARCLRDQSKWKESLVALHQARDLEPDSAWIFTELAHTYRSAPEGEPHDLKHAQEMARRAIELSPSYGWAWQVLAETLRDEKQWKEAIADFEESIRLEPGNAWRHAELARILTQCPNKELRNPQRALELARRAVEMENRRFHWEVLGWAQYRSGLWRESIESLDKAGQLLDGRVKGNAWLWYFVAMDHWKLGNKEEARRWFGKAEANQMARFRDSKEVASFRDEAAELLGIDTTIEELVRNVKLQITKQNWDEAASDAVLALDRLPDEPFMMSARKRLCFDVARHDALFALVDQARPNDVDLQIARGRCAIANRDWAQAAAAYDSVKASLPPPPSPEYPEYACVLLLNGDREEYARFVERFAREFADTSSLDIQASLGIVAALSPDVGVPAQKLIERALPTIEGKPPRWRHLAVALAYYRNNKFDKAKDATAGLDDGTTLGIIAQKWALRALCAAKTGDAAEIEHCREEARQATAALPRGEDFDPGKLPVPELLQAVILLQEAEQAVPGILPADESR